jgi:hypothetical protein
MGVVKPIADTVGQGRRGDVIECLFGGGLRVKYAPA